MMWLVGSYQCRGVSPILVQPLIGYHQRIFQGFQIELARLRPFQIASRELDRDRASSKFNARIFFTVFRWSR